MGRKQVTTLDDRVATQQEVVDRSFQARLKLEHNSQAALDLAVIVKHLQEHPDKIAGCKIAVLGNMFLAKGDERDADLEFSKTNKWLFKIPKDHLKGLLASLRPSLNEGVYTMMNKIDRQSPYKILYRLTAWHGMTPNSLMNKSAFDECVRKQAALVNAPQKIAMDPTGAIDWNSFGIYKCLPPLPEGQDPSKWQYKKLIAFDRFEDSLGIRH